MTSRRRRHRTHLDAASLPALTSFARGYLHQDVIAEHGSAPAAATAFSEDASDAERQSLSNDLEKLCAAAAAWTPDALARFFTHELGAAWAPPSLDEVRLMANRLRAARTPPED